MFRQPTPTGERKGSDDVYDTNAYYVWVEKGKVFEELPRLLVHSEMDPYRDMGRGFIQLPRTIPTFT